MPIPGPVEGGSVEARRFGERFQVRGESGVGGMATVYRATDLVSGLDVALKVLNDTATASAERFNQEAALLAQLAHPAIVRYVDHGFTPGGERYLAMEWLDGETLDDRLSRGPLGILDTLRLGRRVLDGLAVAHRKGIVHRDLKPTNLFLPQRDLAQIKLLDFGIARRTFDARRLTSTGSALGTPAYMSPEQVRGGPNIDHRSDLFSLGSVLYECLTGEPPFVGESAVAVMAKICVGESISIEARRSDLPAPVAALLTRMLAKDPDSRPAGAAEVAAELTTMIDTLAATGVGTGEVLRRRATRQSMPSLALLEQRVVCAIVASRPLALDKLPQGAMGTWDVPGGITRPVALMEGFDESTLQKVERAIAPFGGKAERFLGSAVAVTLTGDGTPTDIAAQAARCALALKAIVPRACYAVVIGRVVVGAESVGELIATGVELLAREEAGAIRLDDLMAGLLEARFDVEHQEATGGDRHHLLFEKGLKEAPRTVLGKEIPCIGRDRELGNLLGLWDEATGEPVARAVLVTSPAGGGKSRVRHELVDRIHSRGQRFELLIGRGDSMHASAPFALLAPALRTAFGIAGGEPPEVQQKRILAHVQRHVRADVARRVAAFLGEIVSVHFPDADLAPLRVARQDPRVMADQTLDAWLEYIDAECAARPVLLVFEDLHWGDVPSIQLVDAALRTLRERPLMVVAFARPEVDDKFPGVWNDRDVQRMALAPMTPRSAQKLVRQILPDLPDDRVAWIVDRADGNPFYLEELVRAVSAGATTDLPDTVLGMVQARFDAIGPDAKRILRAGAIFGQTFRPSGVRSLLGDQDRSLDQWLDILAQKEILFPRQAADTREFAFRHALMQEAAYGMLTPPDRVRGHRMAGEFLEAAGERQAILLVDHYERGGVPDKAAHWCRFAVEQSLDANDLAEVLVRVERGVRLGATGEPLGIMRLVEAQARYWRGEYARAEQAAREALTLVGAERRFAALGELINVLGQQARFDEVIELTDGLVAADPGPDAPDSWLGPLLRSALNLFPSGRTEAAERILSQIEARAAKREIFAGHLQGLRGRVAAAAGRLTSALSHFRSAVGAFELAGDVRFAAEYLGNEGWILGEVGRLEEAGQRLKEAVARAERMNLSNVVLICLTNLGAIELHMAHFDSAARVLERARDLATRQGDWRCLGFVEWLSATIAHTAEDFEAEEKYARAAGQAFEHVPQLSSTGLALLARALLGQRRIDEGMAAAEKATEIMHQRGTPEDGEALIRLTLAEALLAKGRREAADEALEDARTRLFERAHALSDEARRAFLTVVPDHARTIALANLYLK